MEILQSQNPAGSFIGGLQVQHLKFLATKHFF